MGILPSPPITWTNTCNPQPADSRRSVVAGTDARRSLADTATQKGVLEEAPAEFHNMPGCLQWFGGAICHIQPPTRKWKYTKVVNFKPAGTSLWITPGDWSGRFVTWRRNGLWNIGPGHSHSKATGFGPSSGTIRFQTRKMLKEGLDQTYANPVE